MALLVIRHRVNNFTTWKRVFEDDADARRAHGSQHERIFRDDAESDEVVIWFEWDDADRAHLFACSDDLRDAMVRSGVADRPKIWLLREVDRIAF